jgi:hypothetical protein
MRPVIGHQAIGWISGYPATLAVAAEDGNGA